MQDFPIDNLQPIKLPPLDEEPLVSVLVPNYNYAKYIGATIESVLCQTYPHFEIIVCDDGSKDDSCAIIRSYAAKDSRVKLISKSNGGVASALNAAYQESGGEIICLLDADDIWMNRKLEQAVGKFKSDSQSGFVIHNVIQINSEGELIKPTPMYKHLASGWMASYALQNGGFVDNIPPASALSLRRQVAEYIFPLNEEFKRNADSLIFRLAPFMTRIGALGEVLSKFRLHGGNITSVATATTEFMQRELVTLDLVHQQQKKFLNDIYGIAIAQKLTDLKYSFVVCHAEYLLTRLLHKSKLERKQAHQRLLKHPQFNKQFQGYLPQKYLLQSAEYLPQVLFNTFYQQLYGATRLKRVARLLNRRSREWATRS